MSSKPGFKKVANKRDFQKGNLLRVEPDGKPIVLSEVNSKIYAMDAICTHEGAPLEEGNLEDYSLTCPWHYAVFDVRNGKVSDATVWATDLKSYPVEVEEDTGDILVNPNGGYYEIRSF
jgi:nitrite reductase/ring-hydroxylating ferredoxin subunit